MDSTIIYIVDFQAKVLKEVITVDNTLNLNNSEQWIKQQEYDIDKIIEQGM